MTLRRDNFLWQRDAVRHVLQSVVCSPHWRSSHLFSPAILSHSGLHCTLQTESLHYKKVWEVELLFSLVTTTQYFLPKIFLQVISFLDYSCTNTNKTFPAFILQHFQNDVHLVFQCALQCKVFPRKCLRKSNLSTYLRFKSIIWELEWWDPHILVHGGLMAKKQDLEFWDFCWAKSLNRIKTANLLARSTNMVIFSLLNLRYLKFSIPMSALL